MNRRKFLSTVVGGSMAVSAIPIASAASGSISTPRSAEDAGVAEEVKTAFQRGNIQKAKNILESNGVKYSSNSVDFEMVNSHQNGEGSNSQNVDISPQDAMGKGDSSMNVVYAWARTDPQGDDIYLVSAHASISQDNSNFVDDALPKDGIAVTWSDAYFQPVSQSSSNFLPTWDTHLMEYQDYKTYGVWAKVRDNQYQDGNPGGSGCDVGFSTELEKLQSGNEFNVNGEYLHNWNLGGAHWVNSFNLGPAGINFGGYLTDSWRKETTVKI